MDYENITIEELAKEVDELKNKRPLIDLTRPQVEFVPQEIPRLEWENEGGSVEIGVITVRPQGGYGAAAYKKIEVDQNGNWTAVGEDIPVVIPRLNYSGD